MTDCAVPARSVAGGATAAAAGGEDVQSVHGQGGVRRVHPLRPPGRVPGVRPISEKVSYLSGRSQGHSAYVSFMKVIPHAIYTFKNSGLNVL